MRMSRLAAALAVLSCAPAVAAVEGARADLVFEFRTSARGGTVAAALYDDPEAFAASRGPLRAARAAVSGGRAVVAFEALPPGRYALAAFHDVDGDGTLDTWPIGAPREPYGYSNDARGRFGPAAWRDAVFEHRAGAGRRVVTLK